MIKPGAGKKLTKGPSPSEPAPQATTDRLPKKNKGPNEPSAATPPEGAEEEFVDIEGTPPPRKSRITTAGTSGSRPKDRRPRGKRIPLFDTYFPPKYWTKSERADLEVIFTRFRTAPLIGDHLVLDAYRPPFLLDRVDSAHDDPDVCMMALQNAYLPADREVLKERDYGLLVSEMFMHFKKVRPTAS